jgi:hypothetical protein
MSRPNRSPSQNAQPQAGRRERAPANPSEHTAKPIRNHTGAGNDTPGENPVTRFGQSPCDRPKGSRRPGENPSRHRPDPVEPLSHGHKSKTHKARPQRS